MEHPGDPKKQKHRKPYQKPTATRVTPEEAKLKIANLAEKGDEAAKDLLEAFFPDQSKNIPKKKSA